MPKSKAKDDSDSGSDSSSDPKPEPKKSKVEEKKKKKPSRNDDDDDEEPSWPLDKKRFLKVREFKGRVMVDIREYYEADSGDLRPGKKGISLSAQQWRKLVDCISEVDEAIKRKC